MSFIVLILLSTFTYHYGKVINQYTKLDSVKYSLSIPSNNFSLSQEKSNNKLEYSPVVALHAGLSITKNDITLGASFVDPLSKEDKEKGIKRSKYFDFTLKKAKDHFIYEAYYQHYSGYQLNATNYDEDSLFDIENINFGIDVKYFLKKDFKAENTIGHFAITRTNDWSTFLSIGLQQNSLLSKDNLVPLSLESEFPEYKDLKGFYRETLYAQYGYAGQYLYNEYYLQPLVAVGMNLSTINYKGNDLKTITKTGPSISIQFNFGKKFTSALLGFEVSNIMVSDKQNDKSIDSRKTEALIYYNYFF